MINYPIENNSPKNVGGKTQYFRQAVGKVEFSTIRLRFDEWVGTEYDQSVKFGCSHGNSNFTPPSAGSPDLGGTTFFERTGVKPPEEGGGFALMKGARKFRHIINMYIGRSNENGEPWISPGNTLQMRIVMQLEGTGPWVTAYEKDLYTAPTYKNNTIHEITGPININYDFLHVIKETGYFFYAYISMQLKLAGEDTEQQEDVCILGERSAYWGVEALQPIMGWEPN